MGKIPLRKNAKPAPSARDFWVIATQNPVEFIGTYPLAEAQLDRFYAPAFGLPQPQ